MKTHRLHAVASALLLAVAVAAAPLACTGAEKTKDASRPSVAKVATPATGKTYDVKMYGNADGYRFEPKDLTIAVGDNVTFVAVDGGPHNVAFDPAGIPADAKEQLSANMPSQVSELTSPYLMNEGETYTVSFAGVKPGTYAFHCTPHLAMNMVGTVTVH
jgi:plastocyanin